MAKILSPIFKARRTILSHQDGDADESVEIDFRLGQSQAIELFSSVANIADIVTVGADDAAFQNAMVELSLHRRVGTLVNPHPAAAIDELQYEILHLVQYSTVVAQVATESTWLQTLINGPQVVDYRAMFGKPVILAGNLSVQAADRGAITGAVTWNHLGFELWYRYIQPTAKELNEAFFARA